MSEIMNDALGEASVAATLGRPPAAGVTRRRDYLNVALLSGVFLILALILGSFLVPAFSRYGVNTSDATQALDGPSFHHLFGTDSVGFDIFTRVLYAARLDLAIAAAGTALGFAVGVPIGLSAGYSRGFLGEITMRIADLMQAFPVLILALALVALTGNHITNVIWAIAFVNAPIFLRLVRSRVLVVRELRYVETARAIGNSQTRLLVHHILPNSVGPVIVQLGVSMGHAVMILAGLAFLGVGVQAPTAEWGSMILQGSTSIITGQWWVAVFPGVALALAVAGFNLLAEGIERARELA